eukprot:TRINITY_DN30393_c0_g1_i1.p2 TRINITY_DN30393_c0_g1~~TRINITY_DN30393_c0_g1_i1.p2  ORF type:complete len:437 (+),score=199.19 TRINITY_DN30393_c0_g1_i1:105-1415(+)
MMDIDMADESGFPRDIHSDFARETGYTAVLHIDYNAHPELREMELIGYDGKLYDIARFAKHHPGGEELLRHFVGRDVSIQVRAFHERDVMEGRAQVGTYHDTTDCDPAAKGYKDLIERFRHEGYFRTSYTWYLGKMMFCFAWLVACLSLLQMGYVIPPALCLALFWQQCGFFMHDFMHNQLTHNRHKDRWWGMLFGTGGVGVGGHWWKAEHFIHHALTNVVDLSTGWSDPQMREDVWAQNRKLFPLFQKWFDPYLIMIQQYTWLPLTVFFGRIGIAVDCFREEKRWYEWLTFALHWSYIAVIVSMVPTWEQRALFYFIASVGQGVLSIQLLISHYARPFFFKDTEYHNVSWPRVQTITTINIKNHPLLDWFHGGLNIHIEHHLFPCIPRHHFRQIQPIVKQYCRDNKIEYFETSWSGAILMTLEHLAREARLYTKL